MNLDQYLARLELSLPLPPTLDTLRKIHVAHLGAFPFHNLGIQAGGEIRVDVQSIEEKFFSANGGGYCFEQNTLLAAALRELGFAVTTLLGRAGPPDRRSLNHMLRRVDIDGEPWIADVGFGGQGPLEPLPMKEGSRVRQDGLDYRIDRHGEHWVITMLAGDTEEELYEFSGAPHTIGDVEMANWYTAAHPSSVFRRTFTIQRVAPEERIILRSSVITRYRNGVRIDTPIEASEIRRYARELFGIEISDEPLLFEKLT